MIHEYRREAAETEAWRGFSQVRATQADLRSVEETEREKPRQAMGSAAVAGIHELSGLGACPSNAISTAANDLQASVSFSARKNPQRIPANKPPVFFEPAASHLQASHFPRNEGLLGQAPSPQDIRPPKVPFLYSPTPAPIIRRTLSAIHSGTDTSDPAKISV